MAKMKAAGYIRVSTPGQAVKETSLEDQRDAIKKYGVTLTKREGIA